MHLTGPRDQILKRLGDAIQWWMEGAIAKVPSTKPLAQFPEKVEYGASWAIGFHFLDLPHQRENAESLNALFAVRSTMQ